MATPIRWMKVQRKMPSNPDIKQWYPALAPINTVGLDDIIQGIVEKCTLTAVDMKACLQDLQDVVIEQIQRGNAVDFGELGRFRPRMSSHFYNKAEGVYGSGGRDVADTVYDTDGTTVKTQGVTTNDIKAIGISFYPFKKIKHALTLCNLTFQYNGVKRPVV